MEIRELKGDYDALQAYDECRKRPITIVTGTSLFNRLEAAEFFNVSLAYFDKEIRPKLTDMHGGVSTMGARFMYFEMKHLLSRMDKERDACMNEIVKITQEIGGYDVPLEP